MYTYSIFDADPASSGSAWPSHDGEELDDTVETADEAVEAAREILESEASALSVSDGYTLGQIIWAYVYLPDGSVRTLSHELTLDDLSPDEPTEPVDWHAGETYSYVACCYGTDGDQPEDCSVRVGQDAAGIWWVDDGDDTVRVDTHGPYATREEAEEAASDLADDLHEGEPGEDADAVLDRMRTEAAGEPDPAGEWCVYWETALDDEHVVERYASRQQAEARASQMDDTLRASHPGSLLCSYGVRVLENGEWISPEEGQHY